MPHDFKSRATYPYWNWNDESANDCYFGYSIKNSEKEYFEALATKRITALAFEFIKDEDGSYPAVKSLSEIAGTASILVASN